VTNEERKAWLQGLSPGDMVLIRERWRPRRSQVLRVTKTQIVIEGPNHFKEQRYRRKDGLKVGDYRAYPLEPLTKSNVELLEKSELASHLHTVSWERHSLSALRAVLQVLDKDGEAGL